MQQDNKTQLSKCCNAAAILGYLLVEWGKTYTGRYLPNPQDKFSLCCIECGKVVNND